MLFGRVRHLFYYPSQGNLGVTWPMVPMIALAAILIFIALFVYALITGNRRKEALRRKFFEAFAQKGGMEFREIDPFNLKERLREFGAIGYARNEIRNVVWQRIGKDEIFLFDQAKVTTTGGSRGGYFTICLIESPTTFNLRCTIHEVDGKIAAKMSRSLSRAGDGMVPVEFGDPEFDHRYVVFSDQPETLRRLLGNEGRRYLLQYARRLPMPVVIQIRGDRIAVHNSGQSPKTVETFDQLQTLFDLAKGLRDLLRGKG